MKTCIFSSTFCARQAPLAARLAVPFDVDHRRQRALDPRHVADEPVGLLAGGAAPVEEVIGAALQAGLLGARASSS